MKKVFTLALIGAMSLSTVVAFGATKKAVPTSSTVYVNGRHVEFDAYNIDGNNYFKVRDLAEAIKGTTQQFEVNYDSVDKSVKLFSNAAYTTVGGELSKGSGTTQNATDSDSKFFKDGNKVDLNSYNICGNNYTKLRDIGEMFGLNIGWEQSSSSVVIVSSDEYKVRDNAYTQAGLTEYQKTAAENYVSELGLSVADAIARTKATIPATKPVPKPTIPAPKPTTTTPEAAGWSTSGGFPVDKDGLPLTGGMSRAAIEANGGDVDSWINPDNAGNSGTAYGDQGFN